MRPGLVAGAWSSESGGEVGVSVLLLLLMSNQWKPNSIDESVRFN